MQLEVELWYDHEPVLDGESIAVTLREAYPDLHLLSGVEGGPFVVQFPADLDESCTAPILVQVMHVEAVADWASGGAQPERDLTQTWTWSKAEAAMKATTHRVVLRDLLGLAHAAGPRVGAFLAVLRAVVLRTSPVGTWWPVSQVALDPQAAGEGPLGGAVNVRMFRDANRPGNVLMDTLGLHALGYPDAQIYFSGLPESRVASYLFVLSRYVFGGHVVEHGHTVQGLDPDEVWGVTHQDAMVAPGRLVLDIDPAVRTTTS